MTVEGTVIILEGWLNWGLELLFFYIYVPCTGCQEMNHFRFKPLSEIVQLVIPFLFAWQLFFQVKCSDSPTRRVFLSRLFRPQLPDFLQN